MLTYLLHSWCNCCSLLQANWKFSLTKKIACMFVIFIAMPEAMLNYIQPKLCFHASRCLILKDAVTSIRVMHYASVAYNVRRDFQQPPIF